MSANDNQYQFKVEQEKRMSQEERLNEVIRQLRADKRRITNQRKLLLSIILRHEYTHFSCKEIYYEAKKQDYTWNCHGISDRTTLGRYGIDTKRDACPDLG